MTQSPLRCAKNIPLAVPCHGSAQSNRFSSMLLRLADGRGLGKIIVLRWVSNSSSQMNWLRLHQFKVPGLCALKVGVLCLTVQDQNFFPDPGLLLLDFQLYLGPRNANLSGGHWALHSALVPRPALLVLLGCWGTVPLTVRTLPLPASLQLSTSSSPSPVQEHLLLLSSIPLSLFWTSDMPVPLDALQLLSWKGKQSIPIHFPRILQTSFLFIPQFLHM